MTMPRTLALCSLALLWVREAITLADLLRMVSERHVPYINIHEVFPVEMRLFGKDVQFFNVRCLPSYSLVHKEAVTLARILQLPSFPTVSQDCLHPFPLTVCYLLEANLPNELHVQLHLFLHELHEEKESGLKLCNLSWSKPERGKKKKKKKKPGIAEHLKFELQKFQKFTDSAAEQSSSLTNSHASFHFSWGKEEGSDGPSMYNNRLDCTLKKDGFKYLSNRKYWHPELKLCPRKTCGDHFLEIVPSLSRMYVWVLDLFSFILGVRQAEVHKEVLNIERRFLKRNHQPNIHWTLASCEKKKKNPKTATHVLRKKIHVHEENITDGV